ncbi:MAG TPA: ABC transporter permease [Terracidiphilus sp.]|nr:ABC transporter permease [Terracidiphilus sp.]
MLFQNAFQDLRYALHQLRKSLGFTFTVVLMLALGIGANTAIFNVVNTTFLRALPYPDSGRLLWITERNSISNHDGSVSYPNFLDWRAQQDSFSELSVYQFDSGTLKTTDGVERVPTLMVSDNFFAALGVRITQGRGMIAEDDKAGAAPVGWLSYAAWQRYFAADPSIVGRTMSLDGQSMAVAGILPADFRFSQPADVYLPVAQYADRLFMNPRNNRRNTFVVGRLKPGVTLEAARSQMDTIARRLQTLYPEANTGIVANVMPLREHLAGPARTQLLLLLGAVGAILLIACVNLANMLLARSAGRRREMAIRAGLGASRFQLMRQLLVESLLLSIGGGALGLLFGKEVYHLVFRLVPLDMQQMAGTGGGLDWRVLLFVVAVTLVIGIGFGLAPAWQSSQVNPSDAMKSTECLTRSPGGRFRAGDLLVVSQVALAFTLLVGAGLLIRTLERLAQVDPGFKPEHVLSLKLSSPPLEQFWRNPLSFTAYYERILETAGNRPEVDGCGVVTGLPFSGYSSTVAFYPEGRPDPAEANVPNASIEVVSPGYFRAMGIPLVRGRLLSGREQQPALSPGVEVKPQDFLAMFKNLTLDAVISQRMAKEFWPGEDPVGKRFRLKSAPNVPRPIVQIVGVVGNTTQFGLDQGDNPEFYLSLHQMPIPGDMFLAIRTSKDSSSIAASMRSILRPVIGDRPITDMRPMTARIADSLTGRRFNMDLFTSFAGTALLLALIGIYGVLAFTISRNTREMGIRMALGASRARILRGVLWRGFRLILPGILVGLAGAWAVGRLLQSSLFGITRSDPITYIGSTGAFLLVAFLACLLPARRAAKVDPMVALRYE